MVEYSFLKLSLLILLLMFSIAASKAQSCSGLGQVPAASFPVCGLSTFAQNNVPICSGRALPAPPCGSAGLFTDRNPFWYKFTCFSTGTLGFLITPNVLSDDYDWQLFDVTGKPVDDVFTDPSMFVCCNWSGQTGATGATAAGTSSNACDGNTPNISSMPILQATHEYLLLISHFTNTQSGYTLSFENGSASITDNGTPSMLSAKASCDGKQVWVTLNKNLLCNSLTATGSEFVVSSPTSIVQASALSCTTGYDADFITITMSNALLPGNYTLSIKTGSDGNTLLDNCSNAVPVNNSVAFTVFPVSGPTLMDSISPVPCSSVNSVKLVFKDHIRCSSIAADGSDFIVTGPAPVVVAGVSANCVFDGMANAIVVNFAAPISVGGNYTIKLIRGTDNNTLINECGVETPVNSTQTFTYTGAMSLKFSMQTIDGCKADTVSFAYIPSSGVTQSNWTFDDIFAGSSLSQTRIYNSPGTKKLKLWVSNGTCEDSTVQFFNLPNDSVKASFSVAEYLCPTDIANFKDNSSGNITHWNWDFGNGFTSNLQVPTVTAYPTVNHETNIMVKLVVNGSKCYDTTYRTIKLVPNCSNEVPTAFTPNGDGKNDYLYPLYAYKADKLLFRVYNRYGQLIFSTQDWTIKWDGTLKGVPQDTGVYIWMLQYTNRDTGQPVFQKGTTVLIR